MYEVTLDNNNNQQNFIAFGVGCFHFAIKKDPPFSIKGNEYIENIKSSLDKNPNITDINIYYDDDFKNHTFNVEEEIIDFVNGGEVFPSPLFGNIEFTLTLSFKLQAQLLKVKLPDLSTYTEIFKAKICYGLHHPIVFVELISPTEKPHPSEGIQVVREFLKQEMNKHLNSIEFKCLGPSPFHVDFFIQKEKSTSITHNDKTFQDIQIKRDLKRGYNEIIFSCCLDLNEAKEKIFEEIEDELSYFYYFTQCRVRKGKDFIDLTKTLQEIINLHDEEGIKAFLKRIIFYQGLLNKLVFKIADFESRNIFIDNELKKDFNLIYARKKNFSLKDEIDAQMAYDSYNYPINEIRNLVGFLHEGHSKNLERFTNIISAIIGGIIGSLITACFKQN